jgi:hypothetical protein
MLLPTRQRPGHNPTTEAQLEHDLREFIDDDEVLGFDHHESSGKVTKSKRAQS